MAVEALVEAKFNASRQLVDQLIAQDSPLLASYWQFSEDDNRWTLILVPTSTEDKDSLFRDAIDLLVKEPYRSIFGLSDARVDRHQIERAKALGAYFRYEPFVGRRIDTTFTGGQFFEAAVPVYFKPELMTHLSVAS